MEPAIVRLEGDWDIYRRDELHDRVAALYDKPKAIVDLSGVHYIDSTALSEFVRMRKTRKAAGFPPARFVVTSPNVRKLFAMTGLDQVWPMFESLDDALAAPDVETPA